MAEQLAFVVLVAGSFAAGWAWATIRYMGSSDE